MAILDHLNVDKEVNMIKLDKKEMKQIKAGAISGNLLNYILRGANIFLDVGRYFGSSIRRIFSNNMC